MASTSSHGPWQKDCVCNRGGINCCCLRGQYNTPWDRTHPLTKTSSFKVPYLLRILALYVHSQNCRISGAKFDVDGQQYRLAANEGTSSIHGGEVSIPGCVMLLAQQLCCAMLRWLWRLNELHMPCSASSCHACCAAPTLDCSISSKLCFGAPRVCMVAQSCHRSTTVALVSMLLAQ